MSNWEEEQRRKERERQEDQRAREKERADDRRHREQMQLEEKRDRVASMRARGMGEDEIKKSEFKRGCFPLVALIIAGLMYLIFVGSRSESASEAPAAEVEPIVDGEEADPAVSEVEPAITVSQNELAAESLPAATDSPSASNEIKFVSEPVIQPLPSNSAAAVEAMSEEEKK